MAAQEQALVVHPGTAIAPRSAILEPNSLTELEQLGKLMAASGFFSDARQGAQACVKILAGREMGFPPIASMTGISIIDGKPATGSTLLAAAMKRAGYTWQVLQRDAKGCRLSLSYRGQLVGPSEFLEEDAKRANLLGKANWQKWPRSMYFARAISDSARTYAPEVFAGIPAYTAEEMGAGDTAEDGGPLVRNDEVPMLPNGSQRAADDVATAKISELRNTNSTATRGGDGGMPVATGNREGETTEVATSAERSMKSPSSPPPAAAPLTTGDAKLDQLLSEFHRAQGFDRLKILGVAKAELCKLSGDNDEYYRILGQHGIQHANQVKSVGQGKKILTTIYRTCQGYGPPPEPEVIDEEPADV